MQLSRPVQVPRQLADQTALLAGAPGQGGAPEALGQPGGLLAGCDRLVVGAAAARAPRQLEVGRAGHGGPLIAVHELERLVAVAGGQLAVQRRDEPGHVQVALCALPPVAQLEQGASGPLVPVPPAPQAWGERGQPPAQVMDLAGIAELLGQLEGILVSAPRIRQPPMLVRRDAQLAQAVRLHRPVPQPEGALTRLAEVVRRLVVVTAHPGNPAQPELALGQADLVARRVGDPAAIAADVLGRVRVVVGQLGISQLELAGQQDRRVVAVPPDVQGALVAAPS